MAFTEDLSSTTVTLDNNQSLSSVEDYLDVQTRQADTVLVYIDDGTTGNKPASYDLEHHVYKGGNISDWMFDHAVSSETARSWRVPASEKNWRIDVTNTSGNNNQQYRIFLEARVREE